MQTRLRAKASACAIDSNINCWLPEELQFRLLEDALQQYAMPVLRGGLVRNPASEIVSLMLVCRTWKEYVSSHPFTCHRQVSATGLRIAWLLDAAHLACTEAQSKKAKLKRIPQTVRLLLFDGSRCLRPTCSRVAAFGLEASGTSKTASCREKNCERNQGINNRGRGNRAIKDGSGRGSDSGSKPPDSDRPNSGGSINNCAETAIAMKSSKGLSWGSWEGSRWCQARVLSSQRSPFERSSFPERVPLLALEATHISCLELRWLVAVAASLDVNFLCPLVIRITFSAAVVKGKAAEVGIAGPETLAPARAISREALSESSLAMEGEQLQYAAPTLTQADVAALESLMLAVGSDGPHLYLVPTGAALQRRWPRT